MGVVSHSCLVLFGDNGVCVFSALTSVGALFNCFRFFMKKKVTDEEVGKIIEKIAEKIRSDMDYEFRVAQSQMWIAENDLIDALEEKQYEAYRNYAEKREAFFQIAKELYQRKY